jgi:hypothetical protein
VKKLFSISLILLVNYSFSQISLIHSDLFPDSAKTRIGIQGNYELNANALTTEFISKFYRGGYIDKDMKDAVLERTKQKNRMGALLNMGVFAAFKPDSFLHKKNISFFISVQDRQLFNCGYSKDLYKVGFYGNAAYAGKTADFNGFNMTLLRYQQLQVGIFSSQLDSAARWGIGLSFLKGEQYTALYANTAEMFTSEDGQYIDFNTSIQTARSDTANTGLGAFNGYGASIDIYFEAPFKTKIGDSKIRVSVADIGLIRFNDKSLFLRQDSVFHYTGFNVNSIYDLQDSTFTNTSQDSIIGKVLPLKKQAISVTIPATLNMSFETQLNKRFMITEGIRYIFNGNYNLLAYVKGTYTVGKNFNLSATVGYGGYGNLNYGISTFAHLGKGFVVYAGSNNLEGLITPKKACGQSAFIAIIKNFK